MKNLQTGLLLFLVITGNAYGQVWTQYADTAENFARQGDNDNALTYYYKAKESLKKDSASTPTYGRIINSIGILLSSIGELEKAEIEILESRNVLLKVTGKNNNLFARNSNSLAMVNERKGNFEKAEFFYNEALGIREKLFGKDHPLYAGVCNNLANLYKSYGQYEKAELFYLESKRVSEKILSKGDPSYLLDCINLASLYDYMGQIEKSENLYLQLQQISDDSLGSMHPVSLKIAMGLGSLYNFSGQYKKAENLYLNLQKSELELRGNTTLTYGQISRGLGSVYFNTGRYEEAEFWYSKALNLLEKYVGRNSLDYIKVASNIATAKNSLGQMEKAKQIFLEVRVILEKLVGLASPDFAINSTNLGTVYADLGDLDKAEVYFLESLEINEKVLGKNHYAYSTDCARLGSLYTRKKIFNKATDYLLLVKNIREKLFGKHHPEYAQACIYLGDLYRNKGEYQSAENLFAEAKIIIGNNFSKEHIEYAVVCHNMAGLLWNSGKQTAASLFYKEAITNQQVQIIKTFSFISENEKLQYLNLLTDRTNEVLSFFTTENMDLDSGFVYDLIINKRNSVLTSSRFLRASINNINDITIKNKFNKWIELREKYAYWSAKAIDERKGKDKLIEEEANAIEKEIVRFSSLIDPKKNKLDWNAVKFSLQANEATVEFAEFRYYNGKRWTDSIYYIAVVLRKDASEPELIKLFEKRQLDSILSYKNTSAGQVQLSSLYTSRQKETTKSLYDVIWKPIEQKLTGINTVYFSPAGSLHKISFAALAVNDKEVLSDKHLLVQLNTTASIADKPTDPLAGSDKIILYGGVQYDADSTSIRQAALQYSASDVATRSLPDDLSRDGVGEFYYLSGSENEVAAIGKLARENKYSVLVSDAMMATEESFKALTGKNSPTILHIATHGFFFPDPMNKRKDDKMGGAIVFKQSDNPLIRSGLALAGANNAWKGKPVAGVEDGILTSYEVSNMYLPNTKLAVLSACETGLGDIQGSEGVYGLQRAFKMAGVENLIMSLWKVDDVATSEFMQEFYKNLFTKQIISTAFYNAQTIMKNKYRNDPYRWAAWVLIR